jgi:hypothetical protein
MTERNQGREAERLSEEAARRLLERATELEAARSAGLSVAELREAAREAGITPDAFEQALTEFRGADPSSLMVPPPAGRWRLARFWPVALMLAALLSVLFLRLIFPAA